MIFRPLSKRFAAVAVAACATGLTGCTTAEMAKEQAVSKVETPQPTVQTASTATYDVTDDTTGMVTQVMVPLPVYKPGTELAYAAPVNGVATVEGLQQSSLQTAANTLPSTAAASGQTVVASPALVPTVMEVASLDSELPSRVAIPEARPGSALAYATSSESGAVQALEMQTNAGQVAELEPATRSLQLNDLAPADTSKSTVKLGSGAKPELNNLIAKYALLYGVPERLVHRVAKRESTYNPSAYHGGNYGLMQIRYNTARGLGYNGRPDGLLDAETNLKYAVKYLRGAWLVANGDEARADKLYISGYYYHAKRMGLLEKLGMN